MEADAVYRQVRQASPKNFDGLHLSGLIAFQLGRMPEAVELLTRAHQIDRKSVVCRMRLGLALLSAGHGDEAERHLREVVRQKADFNEGWDNLAYCLKTRDRLVEAVECHEKAVGLKPGHAVGWYNYGLSLSLLGRFAEALSCHDRALQADPGYALGHFGRAQALHQADRIPEAIAAYRACLELRPDHHEARSYLLFALHCLDGLTREQLFAEHVVFGRQVKAPPGPVLTQTAEPDRRLRIAILSPDLRTHSCAYFIEPILEHLDRAHFEVYLYHDHFRDDAVSARLRKLAAVWRNFVGRSGPEVEKAIRGDAPDILIDLAGHTGMTNRLPLFATRLAPVQITYLGYPNTTGLPAMDYRFTDALADPVGEADAFATEKLVRFSPTAWTYSPSPDAPQVDRCDDGTSSVTFGCFNSLSKITDAMLALWGRIMQEVPGSRLILKGAGLGSPDVKVQYVARLVRLGVPVDRVELLERTAETSSHLAVYQRVDIALDTYPYHGTTTTCEALWMGVPVITLAGDRHMSRVGTSLLTGIGHAEWVTTTPEDYTRVAVELAKTPAKRATVRAGLRQELQRSALFDHAGQAERFGAALRACWREWCQNRSAGVQ
jgi:protein O-GlcNAc transferase